MIHFTLIVLVTVLASLTVLSVIAAGIGVWRLSVVAVKSLHRMAIDHAIETGICAGVKKYGLLFAREDILKYALVHAQVAEPAAFRALDPGDDVLGRWALAKLAGTKWSGSEEFHEKDVGQ